MDTYRLREERGFTLLEVVIVGMVMATLIGTTMMVLPGVIEVARGNSASSQATAMLQMARERAISERRNIEVRFVPPSRVEAWRDEIDATGTLTGQTLVQEATLEQGVGILRFDGVPDTPDGFAPGVEPVVFTGAAPWRFTTEGQLVDANGDVVNGTIFLGRTLRPDTAHGISLFGPTAVIREWRWDGARWVE